MRTLIDPLDPTPRKTLTLAELTEVQARASDHLTFTMTLACPLRCAHCIVDAGPEKGYTTMALEDARAYAAQMRDLRAHGIRMISFTGGEAFLAPEQLRVMSDAAFEAGIYCGVVTSAYWATNDANAERIVARYPGLSTWDMSIDAYHEDFGTFERARRAYEAARRAGRRAVIRFAYREPLTERDRRVMDFITSFAAPEDICSQRIRPAGRAEAFDAPEAKDASALMKPCVTKGLVIRYDGSMGPCCVNLVESRSHPFQLGDARSRPLTDIHDDYLSQPLLQLIRIIGFRETLLWLEQDGEDLGALGTLPEDTCDLCPRVVTHGRWGAMLAERAGRPENRLRIAVLASRILNEHVMLRTAMRDLAPMRDEIAGFDDALGMLEELER